MNRLKYIAISLLLLVSVEGVFAQSGSAPQKMIDCGEMEEFTDSLKNSTYPYYLPIWGKKLTARGVDLPLPIGIMVNYVYSNQKVQIPQIAIGFNGAELVEISDYVRFKDIDVKANIANFRPDAWILPFFNVSGIVGYMENSTTVQVGLPIDFTAVSEGRGPYWGFGMLLAGGFGPIFFSTDMNFAWVKTQQLEKPSRARINGFRTGYIHRSAKHPERNWSLWVGAQFQKLVAETVGTVNLDDVVDIPEDERQQKIEDLTEWYNGLGPTGQETFEDLYNNLISFLQGDQPLTVSYSLTKQLANPWSMAVGAQYQFNRRWQMRTEYNFLGSREQFLVSLNYRFGFRGRELIGGEN